MQKRIGLPHYGLFPVILWRQRPSILNILKFKLFPHNMERNKQITVGLLSLAALLLIANLFGGGFKSWLGQSEASKIRESAASVASTETAPPSSGVNQSGNIPGTNETVPVVPAGPATTIQYEKDKHDFGTANEGDEVKHVFKFKNTGKEPLVISNARGSCGCTVPDWPKEPVAPGASGEIKVVFNTKGKVGHQSKRVTVTANTEPTETFLEVFGEVKGMEQPTAKGQ
jgi:Protein of unknown function (DUF1573)